jgi:hypothetical protein
LTGNRHTLVTGGPVDHDERVAPEVEIGVGELLGAVVGVVVLVAAVDLLHRGQQHRTARGIVVTHRTEVHHRPELRREDGRGHVATAEDPHRSLRSISGVLDGLRIRNGRPPVRSTWTEQGTSAATCTAGDSYPRTGRLAQ